MSVRMAVGSGGSGTTSPLTTKGDLWGFDSTDNRIPVGANTFVLTADSTQALGVKWAAASGGGSVTASGPPVAAQVAVWTSATDVTGSTGLIFSTANNSLGIGPAVSVAATETLTVICTETIASAAGATWNGINLKASTCTISGATSITTATGFNFIAIGTPTLSNASITISDAASLYIAAAPAASGGAAITRAYSIWVDAGNVRFDADILLGTTATGVLSTSTNGFTLTANTSTLLALVGTANSRQITFTPAANASGTTTSFVLNGAAHTAQTAGTEVLDVDFSFAGTLQHASNTAVSTQRSVLIRNRTYSFASATGTIATAAALMIQGAPIAGTNAAITNSYALLIQSSGTAGTKTLLGIAPAIAQTSGVLKYLKIAGVASTGQTASTEINHVEFDLSQTIEWATGALGTQRSMLIQGPTYAFVGASTVTTAVTVAITSAPVPGANATLTSSVALQVNLGGGNSSNVALELTDNSQTGGTLKYLYIHGAGPSSLTASTEINFIHIDLSTDYTWATGDITSQRCIRLQAPSLSFAAASTITRTATLFIDGSPTEGTNTTLTTALAFWVSTTGKGTFNTYFGATPSMGAGIGCIGIANAGTNPSTNPTGGGIMYSNAGAGTWRGSGGTVTAFGPAGPHCGKCGRDMWTVASINAKWKAWCYECGYCGAVYKGGPKSVLARLDSQQRREILKADMEWKDVSRIVGVTA